MLYIKCENTKVRNDIEDTYNTNKYCYIRNILQNANIKTHICHLLYLNEFQKI